MLYAIACVHVTDSKAALLLHETATSICPFISMSTYVNCYCMHIVCCYHHNAFVVIITCLEILSVCKCISYTGTASSIPIPSTKQSLSILQSIAIAKKYQYFNNLFIKCLMNSSSQRRCVHLVARHLFSSSCTTL